MAPPRGDDHDIRELFRRAARSWTGPSTRARQSRWAAEATRPRGIRSAGRVAAGLGLAALLSGGLTLVAASRSPNGPAASVVRLVSHVLTGPTGAPPVPPQGQAVPASSPSPSRLAAPSAGGPAAQRAPRRAAPSPSPSRSVDDDRRPSPSASPPPSPSPSRSPDD